MRRIITILTASISIAGGSAGATLAVTQPPPAECHLYYSPAAGQYLAGSGPTHDGWTPEVCIFAHYVNGVSVQQAGLSDSGIYYIEPMPRQIPLHHLFTIPQGH
jgi:hypothetical protein